MEDIILTREELYELVWRTPMIQLAKKYKISDNGLRKKCKKMNIPTPDSGYWTKLKFNKPVRKKKLPKNFTGKNEVNLSERVGDEPESNSIVSQRSKLAKTYKDLDQTFFQVPDRLNKPDRLIEDTRKTLVEQKPSMVHNNLHVYNHDQELNISVSPKNVPRALRLYNALIKLLRYRNHDIVIENRTTYAVIKDVKIEMALREKMRIERVKEKNWDWLTNKYFPTDKFILKVGWSYRAREFVDGSKMLEERLADILADLELRAEKEIERRIRREKERIIEEERRRIEKELRERKEKEISEFKNLLNSFDQWQQARNLREYILAIEEKNKRERKLSPELKEWINWAKQKADWFDPLVGNEDPLLGFFRPELIKSDSNRSDNSYYNYSMQSSDSYWRKPWYSRNG